MHRGTGWIAVTRGPIAYMRTYGALTREAIDATRRLQLEALANRPEEAARAELARVLGDDAPPVELVRREVEALRQASSD